MEERLLAIVEKIVDEIKKNSSSPTIVRELNTALALLMGKDR